MNRIKKAIALLTVAATLGTSASAFSDPYHDGGYAYEGTRKASSISPLVALGTVGIIAGIVIAVKDSHHHHHKNRNSGAGGNIHAHSHSH
jgi:hypothetical protein